MVAPAEMPPTDYDLVIIGGSFSASSLALLLKRTRPETRILLLEKTEVFDRKIGESTSEVSGCFLTKVLGFSHYLSREHFQKHGLRMWFNSGDNDCPNACTEIGPFSQARFPTYQLDRSKLDQHMLETAVGEGCELIRPATVKSFELGGAGNNTLTFKADGETRTIRADWVADCSGKAAMIGRKRGTIRSLDAHPVHSMWVRFRNVRDIDSNEARQLAPALKDGPAVSRGSATNHLMGRGWWSWIIPLSNGEFSAGVTWDERLFTPPSEGPVGQRVLEHLKTHPIGRLMFEHAEPVEYDARIYKNLPYYSTEVCGDGWVCAGDAAGFMDPLYSQGLDYCAHGSYAAHKIILKALGGDCVKMDLAHHNKQFGQSYHRWFNALYRNKYQYLGDADLMRAAFHLDIGTYFIGPVQLVYRLTDREFSKMPYDGPIGAGFARFMAFYNRRFERLARKRIANGTYGRHNLNERMYIKISFVGGPKVMGHILRGIRTWLWLELRNAFTRPIDELPEPKGKMPATTMPATAGQATV
ncbi:NAD(P)/FAD-dependent oxidoreductase [Haloferula sp. A504]|uniref:NAD(P)/FAD-dependent oxidoreductase n=1 Tax=Haloferula sp. A504 TaxID=3373601 RepID=UPI0031CC1166|nr:NAD(P)/FAD-dependent oxidoreductase [Verrucomicrobiaceae bacterium E54]